MGRSEFFLGIKFDWTVHPSGEVDCCLSQEAYAATIVEEF